MIRAHVLALNALFLLAALPALAGDPRLGTCTHFAQGWDHKSIMPLIEKSGIGWIRDDLGWESVESAEGVYKVPDRTRAWIRAAHAHHLRLLLILNGGNKLYADRYDPQAYAKCAAWIVTELKDDIDAIEILNEPNNFGFSKFYGGQHDGEGDSPWVAKYVTLMNTAADAIRAANPNIPIVAFGAGPAVTYRQLALKTSPAVTALADHPYSNHLPPELLPGGPPADQVKRHGFTVTDDRGSLASLVDGLRRQSEKFNGPKSIWLTEWGFSTFQPLAAGQFGGFSESAQAKYILRRFVESVGLGVDVSFLYMFRDYRDPHDAEQRWGLVRENGDPKPSFHAVVNLAEILRDLRVAKRDEVGAVNVFPIATSDRNAPIAAYRFVDDNGRPAVALWATDRADGDLQPRVADVELLWGDSIKSIESVDVLTGKIEEVRFKRAGARLTKDALTIPDYPILLRAAGGPAISATAKPPADPQISLRLFDNPNNWNFNNGQEFPGAKGFFEVATAANDRPTGVLHYDFTAGGAYVSTQSNLNIPSTAAEFRISARSTVPVRMSVRLIDATDQCHQFVVGAAGTGAWETLRIPLDRKASEHWAGANDAKLHFPLKAISLCVNKPAKTPTGKVEFTDALTLTK